MTHQQAFQTFVDPPREFGIIPFWFWNDDLDEEELLRQLHAFHEAGFGGVLPHARIGLAGEAGYLTDEYFRLIRRVVEEAATLDMKVILYDEGSYPSGSANGAVVATNPEFATRAICLYEHDIAGPHQGFWRPNTGRALLDRHVCTVLGQLDDGDRIDPASLKILDPHPNTIFRLDVPAGRWKAMGVWSVPNGGTIRGTRAHEEDGHATAPAAGDILNPDAVACFIRLTHDRYYEELGDHFGNTIVAMFTDEPSTTGRGGSSRGRAGRPYTEGFVEWLEEKWDSDPRTWLPALWQDYGDGTEAFRQKYRDAVQARLHEVFYRAQSDWCREHGIDLTGHPSASNDMASLRLFQLPGQDMVWRYVEPGKPTRVEGDHSVAAKAATSGARLSNRRRVLTEVCGAYGWHLTLDEVKWLFDWHLVRGNNLINPHAVFYSIRDRRAWESEPDLAVHNVWWPHFGALATYARRLSWLLCDGEHVCDVAILGDGNNLPWQAARQLYERQIDFLYVDDPAVAESSIEGDQMLVGAQRYRVVVVDALPHMTDAARANLDAFQQTGGVVIGTGSTSSLAAAVDAAVAPDLRLTPGHPDLRFIHYRKSGLDCYLLVNEGEEPIVGEVALAAAGAVEVWDPLNGKRRDLPSRPSGSGIALDLDLGRRESLVVAVDPARPPEVAVPPAPREERRQPLDVSWTVEQPDGAAMAIEGLGDWARVDGYELFSGTLSYRADVDVPPADGIELDLGAVGDIAEVFIDGSRIGVRMWAPYRLSLGPVAAGVHELEVRVTNSMANAYDGKQLPSGLMGPVALITFA